MARHFLSAPSSSHVLPPRPGDRQRYSKGREDGETARCLAEAYWSRKERKNAVELVGSGMRIRGQEGLNKDLQCKSIVSGSVWKAVTLKEARFVTSLFALVGDGLAMFR